MDSMRDMDLTEGKAIEVILLNGTPFYGYLRYEDHDYLLLELSEVLDNRIHLAKYVHIPWTAIAYASYGYGEDNE